MNLIHTTIPTDIQKNHMTTLVNACKAAEPLALSAPVEDDLGYDILLLYEDSGTLAAMSFLFFPQEGPCEFCAFVDPKKRRIGYFSLLLDKTSAFWQTRERRPPWPPSRPSARNTGTPNTRWSAP